MSPDEFRRVYDGGIRVSGPLFAAFCLKREGAGTTGSRVGFTVPRAVGKAVLRNRIRRRMREVFRQRLESINGNWDIVVNPRRSVESVRFPDLEKEVERLLARCVDR